MSSGSPSGLTPGGEYRGERGALKSFASRRGSGMNQPDPEIETAKRKCRVHPSRRAPFFFRSLVLL